MDYETILGIVKGSLRSAFVDHFSVCVSVGALFVSAWTLRWNLQSKVPRLALSFALLDATMLPRHHFVSCRIDATNIGRCAVTIRKAGMLLVNGVFARASFDGPSAPPVTLRPGDSVGLEFAVNAGWLEDRPFVPAVEIGGGKIFAIKPFFSGFDDFVRRAGTERSRMLVLRKMFGRRTRARFVRNAHRKGER